VSKPENEAAEKPPLWARRSHLGDGSWRATEDSLAKMRAMGASYLVGTSKGKLSRLKQSFLGLPW
jgi:hypothetical protein